MVSGDLTPLILLGPMMRSLGNRAALEADIAPDRASLSKVDVVKVKIGYLIGVSNQVLPVENGVQEN